MIFNDYQTSVIGLLPMKSAQPRLRHETHTLLAPSRRERAATLPRPAADGIACDAAGLTFNGENQVTNYKTGTEFHFESAAMLHMSKQLSFGLNGFAYKQITGDSGSGAVLGGFEGQAIALGPALDYTFMLDKIPVSTNLRYFHEFDVKNRLEGEAGFLNVAIPLGGHAPQ